MVDRICIIGAGSSGIAACQALKDRGIPFDCFEKGSDIGGLWRYENDNALGSAYRCLHMNTSRETAQYASQPMPEDYPDFPHHTQILAYLEDYVQHFGLRDKIRFRTEVSSVEPVGSTWEVQWRDESGETRCENYSAVLVANGHHWDHRRPNSGLPGTFEGREIHSHFYRTPDDMEGKNVLVVGIGDSAMDIACDTSHVSNMTFLTARKGAWIIPKYLGGKPLDLVGRGLQSRAPIAREVATGPLLDLGSALFARRIKQIQGRPEEHGLPKPEGSLTGGDVTASSEILARIGCGHIKPKPWISRFDGNDVRFADDSIEQIDTIVYCTGYRISMPFLSPEIIDARGEKTLPLYKRVVHPDHRGLYFIGLVDVSGPLNPLSEMQAQWVADLIEDRVALPSPAQMKKNIAREDRRRAKRFGGAGKRPVQVDFFPYLHALQRERKRQGSGPSKQAATQPAETEKIRIPA